MNLCFPCIFPESSLDPVLVLARVTRPWPMLVWRAHQFPPRNWTEPLCNSSVPLHDKNIGKETLETEGNVLSRLSRFSYRVQRSSLINHMPVYVIALARDSPQAPCHLGAPRVISTSHQASKMHAAILECQHYWDA